MTPRRSTPRRRHQRGNGMTLFLFILLIALIGIYGVITCTSMDALSRAASRHAWRKTTQAGYNTALPITQMLGRKFLMHNSVMIGQQWINKGPAHIGPGGPAGIERPGGGDDGGGGGGGQTSVYGVFGDRALAHQPPFTIDEAVALFDTNFTLNVPELDPGEQHFDNPRAQQAYNQMRLEFRNTQTVAQFRTTVERIWRVSELGWPTSPSLTEYAYEVTVRAKVATEEFWDASPPSDGAGTDWAPTYGVIGASQGGPSVPSVPDDAWCLSQGNRHVDGYHWVRNCETDDRGRLSCGCEQVSNEAVLPDDTPPQVNRPIVEINRTKLMESNQQFKALPAFKTGRPVPGLVNIITDASRKFQRRAWYSGEYTFTMYVRFAQPDGTAFMPTQDYLNEFEKELGVVGDTFCEAGVMVTEYAESPNGDTQKPIMGIPFSNCPNPQPYTGGSVPFFQALGIARANGYYPQWSQFLIQPPPKPGQRQNPIQPKPDAGGGGPIFNSTSNFYKVEVMFSKIRNESIPKYKQVGL